MNLLLLLVIGLGSVFNSFTEEMVVSSSPFAVVLMVKNEKNVINKTLKPYIEYTDKIIVFDTGSTDGTVATVKKFFTKNNVKNAHVVEEPFIDFAASRNRALELAEEKFPETAFLLMPDAEWYMKDVKGLVDFCKEHLTDLDKKTFSIKATCPVINFYVPRLIRNKANVRFVGKVHEIPNAGTDVKVPNSTYFEISVTKLGFEKTQQRWLRDEKILEAEANANPNDARTLFYLAQTKECLNKLDEAFKLYEKRSKMNGFVEENYETFFRMGRVANELSKTDKTFTWEMAYNFYATAFKIRSHRIEPLIKLAEHYWPDNPPLCFLFIKRALELPYPKDDFLFVDKTAYEFLRYEIASKSAWYVGDYETGEMATKKVLTTHPDCAQFYRNIACYLEMKEAALRRKK